MLEERDYFRPGRSNGGKGGGYWARHSIVFHLICVNVIIYLLGSGQNEETFAEFGALLSGGHRAWEPWRYFTYQFLHGSFTHLLFNMYSLWLFGRMIEPVLGKARFLAMYLFSGALGGILWMLCNQHQVAACVGASGAVFGVMIAAAMAYPNARFLLIIPPIPMKLWTLVLIYLAFEVFDALASSQTGVAHLAHLGGALGGFLYMRRLGVQIHTPRWLSQFFGFFSPKPRPGDYNPKDYQQTNAPSQPYEIDQEELNRILDKLSRQGYGQLTEAEKEALRRSAEELKRRRGC